MKSEKNYPLVSVIIPTYGRACFLDKSIDSVLGQTYPEIEILVVDDNNPGSESRAETSATMSRYEGDPRVRYIRHKENRNGSAARNTGWRASSGKYLAYLDDDDVFLPEKISKCVETLEALDESYGVCYSAFIIKKPNGTAEKSGETRSGNCYLQALMRTFFIGASSNLFLKKSVVDEIGGFDESFQRNQDIEFLARALENHKIAYIDETLIEIRQAGTRTQRSFKTIDGYAKYYLEKFAPRIDKLDKKDKKRVISVISLERCRVAVSKKKPFSGLKILFQNRVTPLYVFRYIRYIFRRLRTKTSVGFDGK